MHSCYLQSETKIEPDLWLAERGFSRGGGGTLGLFGWGCVAGTLEPLAYTRASSSEFCYPILD